MAVAILRPIADDTLKMSRSSGSDCYLLVNEASADGDSTYIYVNVTDMNLNYGTSWFYLSSPSEKKIKINSYTIHMTARYTGKTSNEVKVSASVFPDGISSKEVFSSESITGEYSEISGAYDGFNGMIIDSFKNSKAERISIYAGGSKTKDKNDDFQIRITQVYVVLDYEEITDPETGTGIFLKSNGSWEEVKSVYKKVDGTWVQQEDPKSLFSG